MGAPLDCSGTNRGEARAPKALRDAGIVEGTGARDAGDADAAIDDSERDARTGVIGFEQIVRASSERCTAEEAGVPLRAAQRWLASHKKDGLAGLSPLKRR